MEENFKLTDAPRAEEMEALSKQLSKDLDKTDKERKEELEETLKGIEKANTEARTGMAHEKFLKANGLEHIRQRNEGEEDYSDLPGTVHTPGPDKAKNNEIAPIGQETQPQPFEPVFQPPLPAYPNHASEPTEPEPVR